jgi:hypothetical protein
MNEEEEVEGYMILPENDIIEASKGNDHNETITDNNNLVAVPKPIKQTQLPNTK